MHSTARHTKIIVSADGKGIAAQAGAFVLRKMDGEKLTGPERAQYLLDVALASNFLGQIRLDKGEHRRAAELFTEGLSAAHSGADRFTILVSLYDLALSRQAQGDLDDALDLLRQGLTLAAEAGDRPSLAYHLEALADLAARQDHPERAVSLLGAGSALLEGSGSGWLHAYVPRAPHDDTALAELRARTAAPSIRPGRTAAPSTAPALSATRCRKLQPARGGPARPCRWLSRSSNAFYPAKNDPKFAGRGLDAGYLTTVPGSRAGLLYYEPDADPEVIAADERRKDTVSATELNTALGVLATKATRAITVPVLDLLGSHDFTTCGTSTTGTAFNCSSGRAVVTQEAPFYSAKAQLHACVIPGSGHDISLARNHGRQVADVLAWSRDFAGRARHHRLPADCA